MAQSLRAALVRVLIIVTNAAFLCIGALLIYFGSWLSNSGWLDIAEKADLGHLKPLLIGIIIGTGGVVILLATAGCVGAWIQNRAVLIVYAVMLFVALVLFIAIAVFGFILVGRTKDLQNSTIGTKPDEEDIGKAFNDVYCGSELAFICNSAPVGSLLQSLLAGFGITGIPIPIDPNIKGLNNACQNSLYGPLLSNVPGDICKSCQQAAEFQSLSSITEWINDKCPITGPVISYCLTTLGGAKIPGVPEATWNVDTQVLRAPYVSCRETFLALVKDTSNSLAIGGTVAGVYSLLVIIFTCWLAFSHARKREGRGRSFTDMAQQDDYDLGYLNDNSKTPQAGNMGVTDGSRNVGTYAGYNVNNYNQGPTYNQQYGGYNDRTYQAGGPNATYGGQSGGAYNTGYR